MTIHPSRMMRTRRADEMFPAAAFCMLATLVWMQPARGPPDDRTIGSLVGAAEIADLTLFAQRRVTLSGLLPRLGVQELMPKAGLLEK